MIPCFYPAAPSAGFFCVSDGKRARKRHDHWLKGRCHAPRHALAPDADTQALRKALWHYRIGHRITDEEDGQLLWVADPRQYDELRALVARWERGDELISDAAPPKRSLPTQGLVATLRQVPVTALMILISLAVFALTGIWGDLLIVSLTIVPVGVSGGNWSTVRCPIPCSVVRCGACCHRLFSTLAGCT